MNTDFVVGVSDQATNNLNLLFNTDVGHSYLNKKHSFEIDFIKRLPEFGFSTIANILASIKIAKYMKLGKDEESSTDYERGNGSLEESILKQIN